MSLEILQLRPISNKNIVKVTVILKDINSFGMLCDIIDYLFLNKCISMASSQYITPEDVTPYINRKVIITVDAGESEPDTINFTFSTSLTTGETPTQPAHI